MEEKMNEKLLEQIKELIDWVKSNALNELSIKTEDLDLKIKNTEGSLISQQDFSGGIPQTLTCSSQDKESDKFFFINSPLVGTFYRSPAPSSPSFVEVGDEVEPRQTLCIIEAMKVMNEIVSEKKGKVVEFLVENGEMVDYGKALVKMELLEETD